MVYLAHELQTADYTTVIAVLLVAGLCILHWSKAIDAKFSSKQK